MLQVVGHSSLTDVVRVGMYVEYDTGGVIVVGTVTVVVLVVGTVVGYCTVEFKVIVSGTLIVIVVVFRGVVV